MSKLVKNKLLISVFLILVTAIFIVGSAIFVPVMAAENNGYSSNYYFDVTPEPTTVFESGDRLNNQLVMYIKHPRDENINVTVKGFFKYKETLLKKVGTMPRIMLYTYSQTRFAITEDAYNQLNKYTGYYAFMSIIVKSNNNEIDLFAPVGDKPFGKTTININLSVGKSDVPVTDDFDDGHDANIVPRDDKITIWTFVDAIFGGVGGKGTTEKIGTVIGNWFNNLGKVVKIIITVVFALICLWVLSKIVRLILSIFKRKS